MLLVLGAGSSVPGLIAYTFSAFVLATIVLEFARGTRARKALSTESWPGAFASLIARNRRRYGGYVVHAAIVLLAIGVAGSSAYEHVTDKKLRAGQSLTVGGYTLTYRKLVEERRANANEIRAVLDVRRGGDALGTVKAGKNAYSAPAGQVSNEVGIRTNYLTGEDLFVIAETDRPGRDGLLPRLREAAREPDLARGAGVPARLGDHALAGCARGAEAGRPLSRRRCPRARAVTIALVLAALLAVACVVAVALPFLREPETRQDTIDEPDAIGQRQLELAERRDRALGALKELEFDHRTGKVSDEDYRALVGPLRREAAEALRGLEPRAAATDAEPAATAAKGRPTG